MKDQNYLRLIAAMVADMHKNAGIKDGVDSDFVLHALYHKQDWALLWENEWLLEQEDTPEHVDYVVDVLNTWRFIEFEWDRLDNEGKAKVREAYPYLGDRGPRFEGFDGNNEGDFLGVARILIEKMGRFEEFKDRDLNSHSHTKHRYSAMKAAHKRVMDAQGYSPRREASPDDLIAILTAHMA